eukprot:462915-Prymnesium_polylepis.1
MGGRDGAWANGTEEMSHVLELQSVAHAEDPVSISKHGGSSQNNIVESYYNVAGPYVNPYGASPDGDGPHISSMSHLHGCPHESNTSSRGSCSAAEESEDFEHISRNGVRPCSSDGKHAGSRSWGRKSRSSKLLNNVPGRRGRHMRLTTDE